MCLPPPAPPPSPNPPPSPCTPPPPRTHPGLQRCTAPPPDTPTPENPEQLRTSTRSPVSSTAPEPALDHRSISRKTPGLFRFCSSSSLAQKPVSRTVVIQKHRPLLATGGMTQQDFPPLFREDNDTGEDISLTSSCSLGSLEIEPQQDLKMSGGRKGPEPRRDVEKMDNF
ncbi:hypothetical protein D4764_17G0009260 [Takifugu flavidus]|uniref:Uncharacterized protein n=1 Tax=Takifugu flavidus TaxID=433684 RepID=A0A5C6NVX2_9TELE|nr:hypothetical protein D4764_17G0009260 [Takifugu flavidus]